MNSSPVFFRYDNHFIIMNKSFDVYTNENRKTVSKEHAIHRANKLLVLEITNLETHERVEKLVHKETGLVYEVGKEISTQFNPNMEDLDNDHRKRYQRKSLPEININHGGIHYYLDAKACDSLCFDPKNYKEGELVIQYRANGDIRTSGYYYNGLKDKKHYFHSGKKCIRTELYDKGTLLETRYFTNDNLVKVMKYSGSKCELTKYNRGIINSVVNYDNNKLNGKMFKYNNDGNIIEILNFVDDILDGERICYDETGNISLQTSYKNGIIHGKQIIHSLDRTEETEYYNGNYHGKYFLHGKTGTTEITITGNYNNDLRHGIWEFKCQKFTDNVNYDYDIIKEIIRLYPNGKKEVITQNSCRVFMKESDEFPTFSYELLDEKLIEYIEYYPNTTTMKVFCNSINYNSSECNNVHTSNSSGLLETIIEHVPLGCVYNSYALWWSYDRYQSNYNTANGVILMTGRVDHYDKNENYVFSKYYDDNGVYLTDSSIMNSVYELANLFNY